MDGAFLKEHYERVVERINSALERRAKAGEEVTLLAVSKKQSLADIQKLMTFGHLDFGENYVQEFQSKLAVENNCRWHFIGSLQSNKAKFLVGRVDTIQSVDRVSILETLDRLAHERGVKQGILLQVNIAGESSKGGVSPDRFEELATVAAEKKALVLRGIMAFPPLRKDEQGIRSDFQACRRLYENLHVLFPENKERMDTLSMGTTGDFEWAIEEGATMVRVGTAIFGER